MQNGNPSIQQVFNQEKLQAFTSQLQSETFIAFIQSRIDYPFTEIQQEYNNYIEQAAFGVALLSKLDLNDKRILEVGSGSGILTAWLLLNGVDVIGIEPSALGFSFHADIFTAIWDYFKLPSNKVFDRSAEQISEQDLGKFHLIYSVNVMEHIPVNNLDLVFEKMKSVLHENGIMYHHCPNYSIPFEPHYGLPLIPFFPQLIGKLTGKSKEALWQSVNFITLNQVKKITAQQQLNSYYEQGIMAASFKRLQYDPEFANRHPLLAKISKVMAAIGLLKAMENIPPQWATPMTFIVSHKGNATSFKGFKKG